MYYSLMDMYYSLMDIIPGYEYSYGYLYNISGTQE